MTARAAGSDQPPSAGALRALAWTLGLWAVGVQLSEAIATIGMAATALAVLLVPGLRARLFTGARLRREWALGLFLGWGLLGPLLGLHWPTGSGVARLMDWAFLPVAAAAFLALDPPRRTRILQVAGAVALLSCVAALCQHFALWPRPERFAPLAWTHIPFYRMYEEIPGAPGRFMAGGLLWHRLKFAHVEGLVAIVLLAAALRTQGRRQRVLAFGAVGALFVSVLLFPYARAAVVALAAALGLEVVLAWPDRRRALLVAGGLGIAALLAVGLTPALRQRFLSSGTDEGSGDRYAFRAAALRALSAHPLTGVGLGRFRPSLYATPEMPVSVLEHSGKSHLQWLTIATEMGIPGMLLFTVLIVQLWLRMRIESDRLASAAGRAAIAFFVLLSLLHDPLFHSELSMALVLVLGCAVGASEADPTRPAPSRSG